MATMMGSLYNALIAANVPEEKAQAAAEEAFAGTRTHDSDIKDLRGDIAGVRTDITDLQSDMRLLKWMVGAVLALNVTMFVNQIFH